MRVDMHAHYVPPRILEALERDAVPYGVQVQHAEGGGRCLHFGAGVTLRPPPRFVGPGGTLAIYGEPEGGPTNSLGLDRPQRV